MTDYPKTSKDALFGSAIYENSKGLLLFS